MRAIAEVESFRSSLVPKVWRTGMEPISVGLCNTAIAVLMQIEMLNRPAMTAHNPDIKHDANKTSELIDQINREIDKENAA